MFYQCSKLTAVSFGAGLTNIGTYAFMESARYKLSLPSSLKSIGDYAFYNCAKLDAVTFQEGLASVGKYSFQGTAVTELSLPASLTEYGEGAFFSCASLKSIAFADGSTKVGSKNAFQCKSARIRDIRFQLGTDNRSSDFLRRNRSQIRQLCR